MQNVYCRIINPDFQMKKEWKYPLTAFFLSGIALLITLHATADFGNRKWIKLETNKFRIVISDKEPEPIKIALEALKRDFFKVMGFVPEIAGKMDVDTSLSEIVIINWSSKLSGYEHGKGKNLDGFESHRVYAEAETNRIYLEGYDLRGTIFAIYTFSEKILGVPPLHFWCSWIPEKMETINIPIDYDVFYRSPQVRYRSILPGDQDFFNPWRKIPGNDNVWLETALRLKLNTVETYSTIEPGYRLSNYAYLINQYGLVITSHHTSGLNTSFGTWDAYWKEQRKTEPPELLLSNEKEILEFFRYNAETVAKSGIDNLWTIAFRGKVDQPFWSVFKDAPENERDRGEVINKMLRIQYNLIREVTGNNDPYVRITFYDELADLMSKGYLKPPEGKNMIWTFVAARRDPYPYEDLVDFNPAIPVKLGFYMNFGFASTGAHIAPAEGPWKMEFNYRYINSKSPLYFSVVNVGNLREFLLELSANAKMLWDYNSYNTDKFLSDYCALYFGPDHARETAELYKEYYNAFWQPKKPEFAGMERQFLFQDLRYARAFDHIYRMFYSVDGIINMNPLHDIGYERIPGRTFRIDSEYNHSLNQVDAILNGMKETIPKFEKVADRCTGMRDKLDEKKRIFFNDNLRVYCFYMLHLSKTLFHYADAYKNQSDKETLVRNLDLARIEAKSAKQSLYEAQHGIFSTWYSHAEPLTRTFQIDSLITKINLLRDKAVK